MHISEIKEILHTIQDHGFSSPKDLENILANKLPGADVNILIFTGILVRKSNGSGSYIYTTGETTSYIQEEGLYMYHSIKEAAQSLEYFVDYAPEIHPIIKNLKKGTIVPGSQQWVDYITLLSQYLIDSAQSKEFLCAVACILARLLPPSVSVGILEQVQPPTKERIKKREKREINKFYTDLYREYYFLLTEGYLSTKSIKKAAALLKIFESIAKKSFEFFILKGTIEIKKNNLQGALHAFEHAFEKAQENEKFTAKFYQGLVYYRLGNVKKAAAAWELCTHLKCSATRKNIVYYSLGNIYRISGNLSAAHTYYTKSIQLATELNTEKRVIRSFLGLANVFIDRCLWDKAEKTLKDIISTCTEKKYSIILALAESSLGNLYCRTGHYKKALEYHQEALQLVTRKNHPYECGMILIKVGDALRRLNRLDTALKTMKDAYTVSKTNRTLSQAIQVGLADVYIDLKEYDTAQNILQAVLKETGNANQRAEAEVHRSLGRLYLEKKEYASAEHHLIQSEKIFREFQLYYELRNVLSLIEKFYKEIKNEEKEKYYRTQIIKLNKIK